MAKKSFNYVTPLIAIACIAVIAGVYLLATGGIKLGTGAVVVQSQPASQPQGTGIEYNSVSLALGAYDKFATTTAAAGGNYRQKVPGGKYQAATALTTAGVTITGLPVGLKGMTISFQNQTATGLFYLEEYTFDLLGADGLITNFVSKQLPAARVGTFYAETRKGGTSTATQDFVASETNVDYTLFFRQNTGGASIRQPGVCIFYNMTEIKDVKLKDSSNVELTKFANPSRFSGVYSHNGTLQKCYDLTGQIPVYTPTVLDGGMDAPFAKYLRGTMSGTQANIEFDTQPAYPATTASNVTFLFVGKAKFYDSDNNNILDGYEDPNNGYAVITANVADYNVTFRPT